MSSITNVNGSEFKEVKSFNDNTQNQNQKQTLTGDAGNFEVKSYTMNSESAAVIESAIEGSSVVQKLVTNHFIVNDSFEMVEEDLSKNARWGSTTQENPAVRKYIKTHELFVQPKVTQKFISDLGAEAEEAILNKVAESFARAQNNAYITGSGAECPRGFLTYNASEVEQISASALSANAFNDLIINIDEMFLEGASILMNPHTLQAVKSLTDASGRHIYQAPIGGEMASIYGVPVFTTNDMPFAGSVKAVIANFKKAYISVNSGNPVITMDALTEKPFVKYYAIKRVGGDVVNKDAIKLLSIA